MNTPWKFERQPIYEEHARVLGKTLGEHEGFPRDNDGSWIITDSEGHRVCSVAFRGKAKRGERWNAPDPEGQAIARLIVETVNAKAGPV